MHSERGFTLIELLVVILIVALLAAIAIPVFMRQRSKAWAAQMQSALRNSALAVESYGIEKGGFGDLNADPQLATKLAGQGFLIPDWASDPGYFRVKSTSTYYCVEARHRLLGSDEAWRDAIYRMDVGRPEASPDTCP